MVNNSKLIIIDNFISHIFLEDFVSTCLSADFGWYLNDVVKNPNMISMNKQFAHTFFANGKLNSHYFSLLEPILEKLNIDQLLKAKINLTQKNNIIYEHGFHTDIKEPDVLTAVFYLNTNNGYTKFIDGKIVNSVANRVIIFDSLLEHTGTTCTDEDYRLVLNLNYKK